MPFSERDWIHLRRVHALALERFCDRVLREAAAAIEAPNQESAHASFLALYRLVNERNAALATAFDDLRRSTGMHRLSALIALDVLSDEELAGFQPEVRENARELSRLLLPRRAGTSEGAPE
jgi:hypothetical protein